MTLITKAEWDRLTPKQQGYAQYMQGAWPGSELKRLKNPYKRGTDEYDQYKRGQAVAVQDAQDSDG